MKELKSGNCQKCNAEITYVVFAKWCKECRKEVYRESTNKYYDKARENYEWLDDNKTRRKNKNGYVVTRINGSWDVEHRYIMSQMLNRPLKKGESVHHKNGIRHDNRPENLELWVTGVRFGQRASDVYCPNCNVSYWDAITK